MSGPLNPPRNLGSIQAGNLGNTLEHLLGRYSGLNSANQQKGFNYAMEILHRPTNGYNPDQSAYHVAMAKFMLHGLVRTYGRTWTIHPSSRYFTGNTFNPNAIPNRNNSSASNTNNNRSPRRNLPATPQMKGPAKNMGLRWMNIIRRGPAERVVPLNKNGLPRPKNGNTPVNIGGFRRNSYGIEYSKSKIDKNGTKKVLRFYYTIPTFERLVKKKWSNIRNKQSTYEVSNGIPGYPKPRQGEKPMLIRRRNLSLVRFK